ncbi:sulfotransferase family protein [Novosphingobium sp. MBES04]|uniref:sulfotransferase family protein n=1 Tax=Novosphingobium sp. MBES04 TaxID=1206458 RepID=UPI00057E1810|nr:sulfotransferase [Novosphingobium sp. MBES04]
MSDEIGSENVFFILGSPRSGTTLLQLMLSQAPGVHVPNETKFMNRVYRQARKFGPIQSDAGWANAVEAVVARNREGEFPADGDELRSHLMSLEERSYPSLLLAWLKFCAPEGPVTHFGEKTPEHTREALRLAEFFPRAKFLLILRDPRDVALSQIKAFDRRSLLFSAVRWNVDQRYWFDKASQVLGDARCMTVRYEELVAAPGSILPSVATFLGIPFDEAMLDPSQRQSRGFSEKEVHKLGTLGKVSISSVGNYKEKLPADDVDMIQFICGRRMKKLGYRLEERRMLNGFIQTLRSFPKAYFKRRRAIREVFR